MRAGMIARVLAVVLGLYGVLYLLRRLNRRAAAFGANARARLKTEYLRDMLPSLLPRAGVLAVGYALIVAAAFGVLALAVEPMYVFTEWIPDVLVELSSITDRFWQLTQRRRQPRVHPHGGICGNSLLGGRAALGRGIRARRLRGHGAFRAGRKEARRGDRRPRPPPQRAGKKAE